MMLRELGLRDDYDSDTSDILEDLIKPSLSVASIYYRSVGYLDSKMVGLLADEYQRFYKSGGKAKLLIGQTVSPEDYRAIKMGVENPEKYLVFPDIYTLWLDEDASSSQNKGLLALSWLIANGVIEVRYSIRPKGIHHDKFAYFKDANRDEIVIHGTNNETVAANTPEFNYEDLSVFKSWEPEIFSRFGEKKLNKFLNKWAGNTKSSVTVPAPNALLDKIGELQKAEKRNSEYSSIYKQLEEIYHRKIGYPEIPDFLGDERYKLFDHQIDAYNSLVDAEFSGILALATGSGKTITALHAATELTRDIHMQNEMHVLLIVSVPYQVLADQWVEVMSSFGFVPVKCYEKKEAWLSQLERIANENAFDKESPRIHSLVVVNKTMGDEDFIKLVAGFDKYQIVFIGDECHRLGSHILNNKMPNAGYRIGLSATPWAPEEDNLKGLLTSYFGEVESHFGLGDAFENDVLVPYEYNFEIVQLNYDEGIEYQKITAQLKKLLAQELQGIKVDKNIKSTLFNLRAAVIGSVEEKFEKLKDVLNDVSKSAGLNKLIVYCGSGSSDTVDSKGDEVALRDIERAQMDAKQHVDLDSSRITAKESAAERRALLNAFKNGTLSAIFAIKVLDEGFDMPGIKSAIILASSKNERQFIQRRGRVLRKAPGKDKAYIWDFVVMDDNRAIVDAEGNWNESYAIELAKDELMRAIEFSRYAENHASNEPKLKRQCLEYGLDYDVLYKDVSTPRYEV